MRTLTLICTILLANGIYAQTFPIVVANTPNGSSQSLTVRGNTNTSCCSLTSIAINQRLVANMVSSGGTASSGINSSSTSYWYKVDLPGSSGFTTTSGYVAAGSTFSNPICGAGYVQVLSSAVNIRPNAGSSSWVLVNGANGQIYPNQRFAVADSQNVGSVKWYKVYLPNNCSQQFGWVESYSGTTQLLQIYTSGVNGLPSPTSLTNSNVTNSSASLAWNMPYYPSGPSGNTSFGIYNNSSGVLVGFDGNSDLNNAYSWSSLSSCTSYSIYSKAIYGTCVSGNSNTTSFTTSCCTTLAAPGSFTAGIKTANTQSLSWSSVTGATAYYIDVSTNSSFSSLLYSNLNAGTATTYIVTGLTCATTYYYRVKTVNSCGPGTGTTTSSATSACCSGPSTPTATAASNQASTSFTANWNAVTGATGYYIDVSPNSSFSSFVGSYNNYNAGNITNLNITGLTCNTTYYYRLRAANSCSQSGSSNTITATSGSCASAVVLSSVIPPWQREGDDFGFSMTVQTLPTSNAGWHIRAKVYKPDNTLYTTVDFPTTYSSSDTLNTYWGTPSQCQTLKNACVEGRHVKYEAILDINGHVASITNPTNIIRRKLNNSTIVYYNNGWDDDRLRIPVKFSPSVNYSNVYVEINRIENISKVDMTHPFSEPPNILNTNSSNVFTAFSGGYFEIYKSNSNIEEVTTLPGEFSYYIAVGSTVLDAGKFSLTKIGRLNNILLNNNSTHVVVAIGGIYNTTEQSIDGINILSGSSTSEDSYSILPFLGSNSNVNIWYVAQGNVNSVARNGYDIGVGLEKIKELTNATEIDIICHSKGGLDTRAFIQNLTIGLDNTSKTFSSSPVYGTLKKIVFLGTPHKGSNIGSIIALGIPYLAYANPPTGLFDLLSFGRISPNNILYKINNTSTPSNIDYLNLTGFINFNNLTDALVEVNNSENPTTGGIQLYQNDKRPLYHPQLLGLDVLHMQLHKNGYLNIQGQCTKTASNLYKILNFINGNSTSSCQRSYRWFFKTIILGSKIPNASISMKFFDDSLFSVTAFTDENGILTAEVFDVFAIGDSIKLKAPGYDSLNIPVDSNIILSGKLVVPMMQATSTTAYIKSPSLQIVNDYPVTKDSTVNILVTGDNVTAYRINNPFNQDSIFVPLSLPSSQIFTATLDTGYNLILVRFVGSQDSIILAKKIYYLPGALMDSFAYKVALVTDTISKNAKVFVNNQFYKQISTTNDTIPVLAGPNEITFSKFGYVDSAITVDTNVTINITSRLTPYSYSSTSDSAVFNFTTIPANKYWKGITIKDTSAQSSLSVKQYDDTLPALDVITKSRKFEIRHLNTPNSSAKFIAAALDQAEDLSPDSIYLLRIHDDTLFTKEEITTNGQASYDSAEQKLLYKNLNFNLGNAVKEALVINKKQAPIVNPVSTIQLTENDSIAYPLSHFFTDPDSIKNDMTYLFLGSAPQLKLTIKNDSLFVKPDFCWSGTAYFTLTAKHDWLTRTITDTVVVTANPIPTITANDTTTFCDGDSVTLTSSNNHCYTWSTADTIHSIVVKKNGNYTVSTKDIHNCVKISLPFTVTVLPMPDTNITASGPLKFCNGDSVVLTAKPAALYLWTTSETTQSITRKSTNSVFAHLVGVNGCKTKSEVVYTTAFTLPQVKAGNDVAITEGQSAKLGGNPTAYGYGLFSYIWTPTTGLSSNSISNPIAKPPVTITYHVEVRDSNNCANYDTVVVHIFPLDVRDGLGYSKYKIYPNPTTGNIYIAASNPGTALLTGIDGKLLQEFTITKGVSEFVIPYPPGTYILTIIDENGRYHKHKLVKE